MSRLINDTEVLSYIGLLIEDVRPYSNHIILMIKEKVIRLFIVLPICYAYLKLYYVDEKCFTTIYFCLLN